MAPRPYAGANLGAEFLFAGASLTVVLRARAALVSEDTKAARRSDACARQRHVAEDRVAAGADPPATALCAGVSSAALENLVRHEGRARAQGIAEAATGERLMSPVRPPFTITAIIGRCSSRGVRLGMCGM